MDIQQEEVIKRLKESDSKKSINESCMLIRAFGKSWQDGLSDEVRGDITQLIRDKSFEIIFKNGDVPDRDILWAYGLFNNSTIDDRFLTYIEFCKPYIRDASLSHFERLLFIDYASVAMMLSGDREGAIKFFLENIMLLNLNDYYITDLNEFLLTFLHYYYIPIEWILEIQRKNLQYDVYFNVDNITKRSIFLWSMHCFWNVQHYFNNLKWMDNYPVWLNILKELLVRGELDEAMYVEFYVYHKFGNSTQNLDDWKRYNDEVAKLVEPYFIEFSKTLKTKCKDAISKDKKIKIAILKDRVVLNSPTKVDYSFCKALMNDENFRDNYELSVYSLAYIQKSDDDPKVMQDFYNIGVPALSPAYPLIKESSYYVSHLHKALKIREDIINNDIDIIITQCTNDASDFILSSRSAPLQIYWSHGNGYYDISGIDKRISHFSPKSHYKFESFYVPMDRDKFYNPEIDESLIIQEKSKFPINKDTVVLGVIGRLVKLDSDEYLACIAEILKQNKNTIFIAAGNGNIPEIRRKVERLGISDRFFMPGFVNPHVYGHIIDIFCNTFPMDQGESFSEFLAKKGSFITLVKAECTFEGKLRELKLSDKVLIECVNLDKLTPEVSSFDKFLDSNCIFIYNKKDIDIHVKLKDRVFFADISDDDLKVFADYRIEVVGDSFEYLLPSNFVIEKDLLWCIYDAISLRWWKPIADNIHKYYVDGRYIGWLCSSYSVDEYISKASILVNNKFIRDKLDDFRKEHNDLQFNKFKIDLVDRFREIISSY